MTATSTVALEVERYDGSRVDLRPLFELAEDSAVQLDQYLGLGEVLVARDAGGIVGHLQLVPTDQPAEIELKSMAVLPDRQGRGVGAALVAAAVERSATAGTSRMVVSTAAADTGNLRFYQRTGFRMQSVEHDAFIAATGYPDPITIDGIVLRDRVWLSRDLAIVLPGQDTMMACWQALAQLSPGARLTTFPLAVAAVFPAWEPLNNAIVTSVADRDSAAAQLTRVYRDAGVARWAQWLPSRTAHLDETDPIGETPLLRRDITTLVMHMTLPESLRRDSRVVRTSIAAANLEADAVLLAGALEPPQTTPGLDGWVVLHEGVAVAGAWSYQHGSDCGIYAVETLPQWRRRGFARTLVEHVLADAYAAGARTASLQSTAIGRRLYESLGFTAAGRYEEWVSR